MALEAAQKALNSIGLGFDITQDINFDNCKQSGSPLILIDEQHCRHLEIPGEVSIPDVPNSIKCVGGESFRIHSDVLTFNQVDVGNRPVIGMRLQLEGRSSNRLAIYLQHLASLPQSLSLADNANAYLSCDSYSCNFHTKLKWNCFSYVCTAPVESDDSLSIVTGAQLQVEKKCLLLRLRFTKVIDAALQKPPEWDQDQPSNLDDCIPIEEKMNHPKPGDVTIVSVLHPTGFPAPAQTPKLQRHVDKTEKVRGLEDTPGYWVVSGARLSVHLGKIYLLVKYSLLNFVMQSEAVLQCSADLI